MDSLVRGGITRSGASGSYTYSTKPNMGDKPVNLVSWYDAIRFANWLNNGQGTGDTETGAYTILGGTARPSNGPSITRNPGASWFLPNENEWYKAAYYQPAAQGGDSDNYWLYPTNTNITPTHAAADLVGNISNPGTNVANYGNGARWNTQTGNVTTVGSAGALSNSFYGTVDQGGNVSEWIETLVDGSSHDWRGGSWASGPLDLASSTGGGFGIPFTEVVNFGFRVASVPEPSTGVLAVLALGVTWTLRKRLTTP